jgi:hypothetical protein
MIQPSRTSTATELPCSRRRPGVLDLQLRRIGRIGLHREQRRAAVIGGAGHAAADAGAIGREREVLGAQAGNAGEPVVCRQRFYAPRPSSDMMNGSAAISTSRANDVITRASCSTNSLNMFPSPGSWGIL